MHPAGQANTASLFFPKFSTHCQCVMQLLVIPITLLHTFVTHLCYTPLLHAFVTQCHACHAPLLHVLVMSACLILFLNVLCHMLQIVTFISLAGTRKPPYIYIVD